MLLQRPTGQRITRNSRLDSAEFERAPADLAFLHRFASLCFALASPPSLLSSPLRGSLALSQVPLAVGAHRDAVFPAVSPYVYETKLFRPGLPDRLPRIEILLCANRSSGLANRLRSEKGNR